jgi:hypothetical protein
MVEANNHANLKDLLEGAEQRVINSVKAATGTGMSFHVGGDLQTDAKIFGELVKQYVMARLIQRDMGDAIQSDSATKDLAARLTAVLENRVDYSVGTPKVEADKLRPTAVRAMFSEINAMVESVPKQARTASAMAAGM